MVYKVLGHDEGLPPAQKAISRRLYIMKPCSARKEMTPAEEDLFAVSSQHPTVEIRRVSARHSLARTHRPPSLHDHGRVIFAIDEIRPQRHGPRPGEILQPARQAERPLIQNDRATVVVDGGNFLAVARR